MSKTFTSRPALSQRGRGRGREPTNNSSTQPTVQGERLSPTRTDTNRGGSVRGGVRGGGGRGGAASRGTVGRGASVNRGRGGRGGRMDPPGMNPGENEGAGDTSRAGNSLQNRAMYTGAYTVISPDEKKRRQIMEQAERETKQYEQHRQRNKPTSFSYVGTAGGGEMSSVDEATARQQQIQSHNLHSKTNRLLKEQERRSQQRQAEERELAQKKAAARRKSEMNAEQQRSRQQNLRSDMQRVNQAFLDRLEAQAKAAPPSKDSPSSLPGNAGQHATSASVGASQVKPSQSGAARPQRLSQSKVTSYSTPATYAETQRSGARNSTVTQSSRSTHQAVSSHLAHSPSGEFGESYSEGVSRFDDHDERSEFCHNLGVLQNLFPNYEPTILLNILEQCNGSVDQALQLLEM